MDLKKFAAIFAIMLVALPLALAEDTVSTDAGVTPDSPLYGIDKALDSINLALTFDHAKRAEKALKIAQERLLEVQKMIQEGKDNAAEEAQQEYDKELNRSADETDKVSSDGNKDKAAKALEKLARLQNKREEHEAFVVNVHEKLLDRMAGNLSEDKYEHLQELFSKLENRTAETDAKLQARREAVMTKYKALTGKNESEVAADFANFEKALQEARLERAADQKEKAKNRIENAREKLRNLNLSDFDDDLDLAEELLNLSNGTIDWANEIRQNGNEISAIANLLQEAKDNGTWNETKARLIEAIRRRQEDHRIFIMNKLKEQMEDRAERMADKWADRADRNLNLTNKQEDRLENNIEQRIRDRLGNMNDKEKLRIRSNVDNSKNQDDNSGENVDDNLEDSNDNSIENETDKSGRDSNDDLEDNSTDSNSGRNSTFPDGSE